MEGVVNTIKSAFNDVYKGRTVLITGHTGFKGAWLAMWLRNLGARGIGFSLDNCENDFVFRNSGLKSNIINEYGDIRDLKYLKNVFDKYNPEIVFHLAAQSLVRESYRQPVDTFATNLIGTVNILECIRHTESVKAGVIITTDKCYKNKEQNCGYKECDEIWGYDPYSASKACSEIAIDSYRISFLMQTGKLVASARAGNVIGGGDFGKDRLVPDCITSLNNDKPILVRNPSSVRPWQYILDPLYGYLLLGKMLLEGRKEYAEAWNFGPDTDSIAKVSKVVDTVISQWGKGLWKDISNPDEKMHETKMLCLDNSKAKRKLGWRPRFSLEKGIINAVEWYKRSSKEDIKALCMEQINMYS